MPTFVVYKRLDKIETVFFATQRQYGTLKSLLIRIIHRVQFGPNIRAIFIFTLLWTDSQLPAK